MMMRKAFVSAAGVFAVLMAVSLTFLIPSGAVTDDQIAAFADRLSGFALAHQHFTGMPRSARVAYVRRYLSIKKEETRQKDFEKIVALLQQNQKPTIQGKE